MQNTKRPYQEINEQDMVGLSTYEKTIAIIFILLISYGLWAFFGPTRTQPIKKAISQIDKERAEWLEERGKDIQAEIISRLDARGLSRKTTVKETTTGYKAEFEGKWVRI